MVQKLIALLIVAFWSTMMGLLIRREIVPGLMAKAPVGYENILAREERTRHERMGIYFASRRVGSSETHVTREHDGRLRIENATEFTLAAFPLPMLPENAKVKAQLTAVVDERHGLRWFRFELDSMLQPMTILGRVAGRKLKIETKVGDAPGARQLMDFDPSAILTSGFSPFVGVPDLRIGREWQISMFNPLTQTMDICQARVTAQETLQTDDGPEDAYVVTLQHGTSELRAWINAKGEVLQEETPFGLTLKREKTVTDER
ncbi:MAG: hypothetical protein FJ278_13055 [Planctomycetes bacterium]|nr:hypothetical protein [Planctomycetota bacterium]